MIRPRDPLEVLSNVQVRNRYRIYLCHLSGHAGYVDLVAPRMKALLRSSTMRSYEIFKHPVLWFVWFLLFWFLLHLACPADMGGP